MAIRLITGVPGAGKTYLAVNHLVSNYCVYDKDFDDYKLKDSSTTIITNIDSLTLPHISLSDAITKSGLTLETFFTKDYQEKISKKYSHIIYLIDEAQRFFPRKNRINAETWFYFEYHRHLGHDIYIITQDRKLIAENIQLLVEIETRATKRILSVAGELRYLVKSDGEIIDRKVLRRQKKIYNLYKSMDAKETEKLKNPLLKYAAALLIFFLICGYAFKRTFFSRGSFSVVRGSEAIAAQTSSIARSSKNSDSQSNLNEDPNTKTRVKLNYFIHDNKIYVLSPVDGSIQPVTELIHQGLILKKGLRSYTITALFDRSLLPAPEAKPEKTENPQT